MHGVFRCVSVTNVNTGSEFTMTSRVLNLTGSAPLGSLGTQSRPVQPFWLLPGHPSPTAAVLAQAIGTLGGSTLRPLIGRCLQRNTDLELQFSGWSSTFLNNSQWIITDLDLFRSCVFPPHERRGSLSNEDHEQF